MFALHFGQIQLWTIVSVRTKNVTLSNLCMTRKNPNRNISCTTTIRLFPCHAQNLIVYHCSCKHSLLFMVECTQVVAQTHFIATNVTKGHVNLILHNLPKRWTIHYCFDSCCFHTISVLPLHRLQNASFSWPNFVFQVFLKNRITWSWIAMHN